MNKVDSKVTLKFDVLHSTLLGDEAKNRLLDKLSSRLTKSGVLIMTCQVARSQIANKKKLLERFDAIIEKALTREKPRKKTKPSKAAVRRRLAEKKEIKEKKERRRKLS